MDAISPQVHGVHTRQVPLSERLLLGLPGLGELGDRRGGQPLRGAEELPEGGHEISRREPVQVQQRKHLADLRSLARPRRQDRRREPLPLTGIRVDTLVVDPRCRDIHRAGARGHGPRLVAAIAHHQPMTLVVTNVSELGDVSLDLGPQGLGQHPPRTLSDDLVDYRRRGRPRRTRTIAVSGIRNYSEHRVVPSRPALSRRSCLEPFIGHPGRYAPSQADPQISSIARGQPRLAVRGRWGWRLGQIDRCSV